MPPDIRSKSAVFVPSSLAMVKRFVELPFKVSAPETVMVSRSSNDKVAELVFPELSRVRFVIASVAVESASLALIVTVAALAGVKVTVVSEKAPAVRVVVKLPVSVGVPEKVIA